MPTRLPPRREPRVLAVAQHGNKLLWAVADPWEIRGTGSAALSARTTTLVLRRLVRREKPTLVVTADKRLKGALRRAARSLGVPMTTKLPRLPSSPSARTPYPELCVLAPKASLERLCRLAIAIVLHSSIPIRPYAACRNRTTPCTK